MSQMEKTGLPVLYSITDTQYNSAVKNLSQKLITRRLINIKMMFRVKYLSQISDNDRLWKFLLISCCFVQLDITVQLNFDTIQGKAHEPR